MIAYLEGTLLSIEEERIILLANQVGYEVLVPSFIMETMKTRSIGDMINLFIYFHQTERQPRPVLIGFNLEEEREFFQQFITVEAIGPLKAIKAMNYPIHDIAGAIESKNVSKLKQLNGIGDRTARKIVATLQGKMGKFTLLYEDETEVEQAPHEFAAQVTDVLVKQLGHKLLEARQMVKAALTRNPSISNPEALFEEVYRGDKINE